MLNSGRVPSKKSSTNLCSKQCWGGCPRNSAEKNKTHITFSPPKNLAQKPMGFFPNRKISIQVTPSSTNDQLQSAQEPGFPDFPRWMMDGNFMETGHGFPPKNTDNYARVYHKIVMKYIIYIICIYIYYNLS